MTSQTGQQIITIHILPNNSRSKDSQTMKFGQKIEYNMRNVFREQSYTKCGGVAIARPFFYEKCMIFAEKYFSSYILLTDLIYMCNMYIAFICYGV